LKLDDFTSQCAGLEAYVGELLDWLEHKEVELMSVKNVQQARVICAERLLLTN